VTDFVARCRPLICEPDLVNRWQAGNRAPVACISCNLCFRSAHAGEGLYCVIARKAQRPHDPAGGGVVAE
jgi:2,4-dienoyl-CoA reductase-like NADH-dependent reductase (Old Yellow Enzyme family)